MPPRETAVKWKKVSPELTGLLERAIVPLGADKRMMFGCPVYTVNSNMFAGAHQDSLFVRLPESDRQEFRAQYPDARPFEPMAGRVMKEYMLLPEDVYNNPEALHQWLRRGHVYALSLPPKQRKSRAAKRSGV